MPIEAKYNPKKIEAKWQKRWFDSKMYQASDRGPNKYYVLVEIPYLSGEGLHIGHCLSYIAQDIIARLKRMQGNNVLYPMGWDAFGLPTENYAIKNKIKPQVVTERNVERFRRQIQSLGISFDWSREINTSDPAYYKWTQWIFLQLFKKGFAEKRETPINWCPKDKIGLAFEEVTDGRCERCDTLTERRLIKQWVLKITKYADRLIEDLEKVDYKPEVKQQQINWIGRSEGVEIQFKVKSEKSKVEVESETLEIKVFTTRPDTLFGATYLVLSPENEFIRQHASSIKNWSDIQVYLAKANRKTDRERQEGKEKTGVELKGIRAINPATKEEIPIWVADYIVASYGTGAVMAVPAHDERDFEFARKFRLPIHTVIKDASEFDEVDQSDNRNFAKELFSLSKEKNFLMVLVGGLAKSFYNKDKSLHADVDVFVDEKGFAFLQEYLQDMGFEKKGFGPSNGWKKDEGFSFIHKNRWVDIYLLKTSGEKIYDTIAGERFEWGSRHDLVSEEIGSVPIMLPSRELLERIYQNLIQSSSYCYPGNGILVNSGKFNGMRSEKAHDAITKFVGGKKAVHYKLRDWIFSRQRYWGEPIPIIICERCGYVPLREEELPLELPSIEHYEPTETGESPLASVSSWVNVSCPNCKGAAKRETDTMPNWAGSSWYFLRYADPVNTEQLADKKKLKYWLPVDLYNGGAEHTTLHLLYSRFWHKFLYDIGVVPTEEPYQRRVQHGMILGPDGQKMSKSRGNVISPDPIVERYGADTFRLYMVFMGEYDKVKIWSHDNLQGVWRFMNRLWQYATTVKIVDAVQEKQRHAVAKAAEQVLHDIERRSFNTTVSHFMVCLNSLTSHTTVDRQTLEHFVLLLAPFMPHLAEEIWQSVLGHDKSVHRELLPQFVPAREQVKKLAVQINGKVRAQIEIASDAEEKDVYEIVASNPQVQKYISGRKIQKFIYVKDRIVSIVV